MFKINALRSLKSNPDGFQNFRPQVKPKKLIFAAAGGSVPPPNGSDKYSNFNKILSPQTLKKFKSMNNEIDTFTRKGFNILKKFK